MCNSRGHHPVLINDEKPLYLNEQSRSILEMDHLPPPSSNATPADIGYVNQQIRLALGPFNARIAALEAQLAPRASIAPIRSAIAASAVAPSQNRLFNVVESGAAPSRNGAAAPSKNRVFNVVESGALPSPVVSKKIVS